MDIFIQQVVSGLATGGIYASLALALVMIYQATDVVNFAQGEMAMFTTYLAWTMLNAGVPYWAAFFATLVIGFVGGLLIERIVIRPVEHAPILTIVIVTIGSWSSSTASPAGSGPTSRSRFRAPSPASPSRWATSSSGPTTWARSASR
jgi:branched-chain amino acid transport system permease protein